MGENSNEEKYYFEDTSIISKDSSFVYPLSQFPPLSLFHSKKEHPALIIPVKRTANLRKTLKDIILNRPRTKSIYPLDESDDHEIINDVKLYRKIVLKDDDDVWNHTIVKTLLKDDEQIIKSTHDMEVSYDDWTVEQVLRRLLPGKVNEIPSSFEIVGHIAHVNLRDDVLPYQYIIGKVIYDKNQPQIRTVVNKTGKINSKFRTFEMKVIAGCQMDNWSEVIVKEEGCQFELDFQKVYWNSRLAGEHQRLVKIIQRSSTNTNNTMVVADMMAGVGPFAVPLTAFKSNSKGKKILVHANDLNPSSYKYLNINKKRNKCQNLFTYNMDGRSFIHHLHDKGTMADNTTIQHVLMNLPASAPEFLDTFRGYPRKPMPMIHVHCFGPKDFSVAEGEIIERCEKALGCSIKNPSIHVVRDIAPKKNMFCVSFRLPEAARSLPRITTAIMDKNTSNFAADANKKSHLLDNDNDDLSAKRRKREDN